jgi:hypothetical protein
MDGIMLPQDASRMLPLYMAVYGSAHDSVHTLPCTQSSVRGSVRQYVAMCGSVYARQCKPAVRQCAAVRQCQQAGGAHTLEGIIRQGTHTRGHHQQAGGARILEGHHQAGHAHSRASASRLRVRAHCGIMWLCVAVRLIVCGNARGSVRAVRVVVYGSALASLWQCAIVCGCPAVRQCPAVRLVVYGNAHGSAVWLCGSFHLACIPPGVELVLVWETCLVVYDELSVLASASTGII